MLGDHVRQQGSLVAPDRLRFDFSHHGQPTPEELGAVLELANDAVLTDDPVETTETSREDAERMGAIAFFGDKYGDSVRVVQSGAHSLEFCGGTHVDSLGQIGPIALVSEGSIGSNTRRIEAVTGRVALDRATGAGAPRRRRRPSCCAPSPTAGGRPSSACWPASARPRRSSRSCASSPAEAEATELAAGAADGVVVARRDGVAPDALRTLAQAVLRQDGVRAVVLGGTPDGAKVALAAATGGDARRHRAGAGSGPARRRRRGRVGRAGPGRGQGPGPTRRGAGRGAAVVRRCEPGRRGPRRPRSTSGSRRIGVAYSDSGRTVAVTLGHGGSQRRRRPATGRPWWRP